MEALEGRRLLSVTIPDGFVKVGASRDVQALSGADQGFDALEVGATYYVVAGKPDGNGGFLPGNFYGNTAGIGQTSGGAKRRTDAVRFDDTAESWAAAFRR